MRRTLSIITALALATVPASALADTISVDLATATYDELAAARQQITARMDELMATEATPAPAEAEYGVHYAGEGTTIISDVQLPYDYNLIMYAADTGTSYKLIDNDSDKQISYSLTGRQQYDLVGNPRNAKLLVEGKNAWTLDVAPLESASALQSTEGTGCYASPVFQLDTDIIVNLHITDPDGKRDIADALSVDCTLYALMGDGSYRDDMLVIGGSIDDSAEYNADLILSPVKNAIGYVLVINCLPSYNWQLTLA